MGHEPAAPLGWCLVELMGHRRVAAYVTEQTIAGAGFLRLDVPSHTGDGAPPEYPGTAEASQLVNPSSVYAIHPVTEAMARQMADTWHHEPVQRWELPAIAAPGRATASDEYAQEGHAIGHGDDRDLEHDDNQDDDEEPF